MLIDLIENITQLICINFCYHSIIIIQIYFKESEQQEFYKMFDVERNILSSVIEYRMSLPWSDVHQNASMVI